MKNGTRIFLICIIIVLLLSYVVGFVYCTVNKYASAEEISDSTILNFNQLFDYNSVDGNANFSRINNNFKVLTSSDFEIDLGITADFVTGHKYFVYVNSTGSNLGVEIYRSGVTSVSFYSTSIYTSTVTNNLKFYLRSLNNNLNATVSIYMIDLSLMYGDNEIPTLQECLNIFGADCYPYTTGKPITLNGIDSYNQALNDIFSNYKYMLDRNALSTQTQATDLMGILSGTTNFGYNDENWYILGAMYCPLFTKISAASEFNIEIQLYAPNGRENRYLCFGTYIDNELNEIYKTTHNGDGTTLNINFTTPIDVQTLYVYERNGTTGDIQEMNYIVGIFNIRVEQLDIAGAVMSSYSSGFNTARDYYSEGGQGFADIFARGKAAGLIEANGSFTAMDYVKTAFITIGEILMIEVFPNFTLGAFFLLPLLTSTIFFIIKLTRGGS